MSEADTGQHLALPRRIMRAARSAYDSARSIERLERELAAERQQSETLRSTVAELRFQAETLEKTYSKQLADARLRSDTAESELDEHRSRLAELERAYEDTVQSLTEARRELERVIADRKLLYEAIASSDAAEVKAVKQRYAEARYNAGLATIDELLDDSNWRRAEPPTDRVQAEPDAAEEAPAEEMISPDLVLSSKRPSASGGDR